MEVVMNVAGAGSTPKKAPASNPMSDRVMMDNVVLRQKLNRVMALKEKLLGDKAEAEAAVKATRDELLAAYNTIAALRAQVNELTANLSAATAAITATASGSKKNKRQREEQVGQDAGEVSSEG